MAVIVWVAGSVFSCAATVVLEEVLGVPVSEEDEKMLRGEVQAQKGRYDFYDPEPEYGNYKEFPITPRDDYLTIEYVQD